MWTLSSRELKLLNALTLLSSFLFDLAMDKSYVEWTGSSE